MCDPEKGICEMPGADAVEGKLNTPVSVKPIHIVYFTDPICSSCWGIEPQLRKLKSEYGDVFQIEYHMGGLLPSWGVYDSGSISKPADVAHHWDEVSAHYDMPIDGDVWLEDPLPSSYPPCIAFKAAQLQDKEKAVHFMRNLRELVFLEKKNITKWEYIKQAASEARLNTARLKKDYEGKAKQLFEDDLTLARKLGVRGFPTIFFADADQNQLMVYGFKPYEAYEEAILKLAPQAVKKTIDASWEALFGYYPTLTTKEFSVLSGSSKEASETMLNELYQQKKLSRVVSKNGPMWKRQD